MRISDWSSDVCSSDLGPDRGLARTDFGQDAAGDYRPRYRLGIRAAGAGKPYFDESPQWFLRNGRANQADGRTGGLATITDSRVTSRTRRSARIDKPSSDGLKPVR